MATRAQLQAKRNIAVVKQRQAREKHTAGSTEHLAAMAETRRLGGLMEDRVRDFGDRTSAGNIVTVHNVGDYVDSEGGLLKKASAPSSVSHLASGGDSGGDGSVMSIPTTFARTRMGYDPDTMVDYTNTNPAYWNSVVAYFKENENGNRVTGELGIWIPNFEKQGAESTALAAIAGGVTAHVNSNYSNNTVTDTGRATASLTGPGSESYRGGAEKAIRLNSISRGGTDVATGRPMGGTDPIGYGAHILGGKVVKGAMPGYLKDGGDYGGLLGVGTSITGSMLTGLLGGMDKDGMRLRGTMPSVMGATGSGVGAGGTKTSVGGLYGGGVDPLASMPGVADYTAYMDPNSIFGGLSKDPAVRSGLLYQPMASDYGAKMEAAGMPAFSPGLLGGGGGVGSVTYGSPATGFMKPKAGATGTSTSSTMIGSPSAKYELPEMYGKHKFSAIPTFYDLAALESAGDVWRSRGGAWKGSPWAYTQPALVGGHKLYTSPESDSGVWDLTRTYPLAKT